MRQPRPKDCGFPSKSSYVWRKRCRCVTCAGKRSEQLARDRQSQRIAARLRQRIAAGLEP